MRRAETRQNGDIPGVTPYPVNHETHSTTFGLSRPFKLLLNAKDVTPNVDLI